MGVICHIWLLLATVNQCAKFCYKLCKGFAITGNVSIGKIPTSDGLGAINPLPLNLCTDKSEI